MHCPPCPPHQIKSTTVIAIRHNGQLAMGADGQATVGQSMIVKQNVCKIHPLMQGKILTGFAGSTADALLLLDCFEGKLNSCPGNMKRAAIELSKEWRTNRQLRNLEAMIIAANATELLLIYGSGDVLEPEGGIVAIGSGGAYAQSAAQALKKHANTLNLTAEEMVRESLTIAANLCVYTNHNFTIKTLPCQAD